MRKERWKKIFYLLMIVLILLGILIACGKNQRIEEGEGIKPSEAFEEAASKTLRIWETNPSEVYSNFGDSYYIHNVERILGIDIEFTHPGKNAEAFNLMVADSDYGDIITNNWAAYPGGIKGAYNDGIAIELNDVIESYMPNLKKWMEEHPEIDRKIKSDDGKYYAIPAVVSDSSMAHVFGFYVRQDIMEALSISMPSTIEEWHDALVKMKKELGIAPITATSNQLLNNGAFLNAYVPSMWNNRYSVDKDSGQVVYTAATKEYQEFLITMAQWYKEGLIDKDIATNNDTAVRAKLLAGEAVIGFGYAGSGLQITILEGQKKDPDFMLEAIPGCARNEGEEILYCSGDPVFGAGSNGYAVITTACEDVETAARYLDWCFSEEGIMVSNFGIEGDTYEMIDGVPTYTEKITKNPEGKNIFEMLQTYVRCSSMFPGVQTMEYMQQYYQLDNVKKAIEIWGAYGTTDYEVSGVNYTTNEVEMLSLYETNIEEEMVESRIRFLIGMQDPQKDWDSYIERLNSLGLQETVQVNQAAYDRMMNR